MASLVSRCFSVERVHCHLATYCVRTIFRAGRAVGQSIQDLPQLACLSLACIALDLILVGKRMSANSQSINKCGQSLINLIFGCEVDDSSSADFAQESRGVTGVRCQSENGLANSKVLVGFGGNLLITICGLKEQKPIGVGTFLQGLPVRHVGLKNDQILDVPLREEPAVQVFRARCTKNNLNFVGAEVTHLFQASDRAEHRSWVTLDGIDQSGVNEPDGTARRNRTRRGNMQISKIFFVITIW